MATSGIGALSAVVAPAFSSLGLTLWNQTWTGSGYTLNVVKGALASSWFLTVALVTIGPNGLVARWIANPTVLYWLMLSAFLGIVIGDTFWLEAMQALGARRLILISALKPFVAAGFGKIILGETFTIRAALCLLVTMAGVVIAAIPAPREELDADSSVSTEDKLEEVELLGVRESTSEELVGASGVPDSLMDSAEVCLVRTDNQVQPAGTPEKNSGLFPGQRPLLRGLLLAGCELVIDTYAAVLTKQHGHTLTAVEINFIRFGTATVLLLLMLPFTILWQRLRVRLLGKTAAVGVPQWARLPQLTVRSWGVIVLGVLLVTFIAPSLSTWAMFQLSLAVWNGLSALGPVWAVPFAYLLRGEHFTMRTACGAILAAVGAGILGASTR